MLKNQRVSRVLQICSILLVVLSLAAVGFGQKKKTTKRSTPAVPKPVASIVVKDESLKVANQIKNLTRFIYVLGSVANVIEGVDKDAKAGKVTPAGLKQNQTQKQTVLMTIKNVRAGVVALEAEFHSKPELRTYIPFVQGVSEMAGIAEDQAIAGQFTVSGKTLLEVVNKLTDTLQNLP